MIIAQQVAEHASSLFDVVMKSFTISLIVSVSVMSNMVENFSPDILFGIHKANRAYEKQQWLEKLVEYCEEFKMLVQLAKELKAFKSFKQFEFVSKMAVGVAKQAQAWLNYILKHHTDLLGISR